MSTTLHIGICLDESGSMGAIRERTIEGLNSYLTSLDPKSKVTFTLFSDMSPWWFGKQELSDKHQFQTCRVLCENVPAQDAPPLTARNYYPRGNTPLFDAIGETIKAMGRKLNVLFVIQTDGLENASQLYTREKIVKLIEAKEKQGWRFLYLGVDQSQYQAETASQQIGLRAGQTVAYMGASTSRAYQALTDTSRALSMNANLSAAQTADVFKSSLDEKEL